jgi:hypothetical protein
MMEAQPLENVMPSTKSVENDAHIPVGIIPAANNDSLSDASKTQRLPPYEAQLVHPIDNMVRTSAVVNDDTLVDKDKTRPSQPFQEVRDYEVSASDGLYVYICLRMG